MGTIPTFLFKYLESHIIILVVWKGQLPLAVAQPFHLCTLVQIAAEARLLSTSMNYWFSDVSEVKGKPHV